MPVQLTALTTIPNCITSNVVWFLFGTSWWGWKIWWGWWLGTLLGHGVQCCVYNRSELMGLLGYDYEETLNHEDHVPSIYIRARTGLVHDSLTFLCV